MKIVEFKIVEFLVWKFHFFFIFPIFILNLVQKFLRRKNRKQIKTGTKKTEKQKTGFLVKNSCFPVFEKQVPETLGSFVSFIMQKMTF